VLGLTSVSARAGTPDSVEFSTADERRIYRTAGSLFTFDEAVPELRRQSWGSSMAAGSI
jgi:hypothetical protein